MDVQLLHIHILFRAPDRLTAVRLHRVLGSLNKDYWMLSRFNFLATRDNILEAIT